MSRRHPNDECECPRCGATATCETVDNGVGEQQVTPFACYTCGWVQGGDDGHHIIDENIGNEDRGPYPS